MIKTLLIATLAASASFSPALAQEHATPQQVIERLFEAPEIEPEWFTPDFLAQVPPAQVRDIIATMEGQYGAFQSASGEGQRFNIELERAEVPARLVLDAEGRIAGLWFEPPVAAGGISQQVDAIATLPGRASVLILSDGEVRAEHNADEPLAAGSAAKLAILKAVRDAVAEGQLAWDQVVPIEEEWRSLPTGILQDWPEETPVTIATLANLMMSLSDNTATDALIQLVGREAVEAVTPRNTPFPTTRELFILKGAESADLRAAWREGDEAQKREVLEEIASAALPEVAELAAQPTIDVEWFLSVRELCTLMEELANQPALHINPGVAEPENWEGIAFKGGSEPGVLNFTTRLVGEDGTSHCVAATWNNPDASLDNQQLVSSYRAILRALREE